MYSIRNLLYLICTKRIFSLKIILQGALIGHVFFYSLNFYYMSCPFNFNNELFYFTLSIKMCTNSAVHIPTVILLIIEASTNSNDRKADIIQIQCIFSSCYQLCNRFFKLLCSFYNVHHHVVSLSLSSVCYFFPSIRCT